MEAKESKLVAWSDIFVDRPVNCGFLDVTVFGRHKITWVDRKRQLIVRHQRDQPDFCRRLIELRILIEGQLRDCIDVVSICGRVGFLGPGEWLTHLAIKDVQR
jgi:hypothetical protein